MCLEYTAARTEHNIFLENCFCEKKLENIPWMSASQNQEHLMN